MGQSFRPLLGMRLVLFVEILVLTLVHHTLCIATNVRNPDATMSTVRMSYMRMYQMVLNTFVL